MRPRLVTLIVIGCLLAGGLLVWLQLPNHSSNYLTRWVVQKDRGKTGASSVPIPIDMQSRVWPSVIGTGLFLAGVALFVVAIGMGARRHWLPALSRLGVKRVVALAIVPVLAIVALWRPVAVQHHKVAMRSWHAMPSPFWERHQQALIALGYFEARDFPLERRNLTNVSDLMRLVDPAPFRDGQWAVVPRSNRVSVTAYRGDMALWEDIVARFDRAEPYLGPRNQEAKDTS
jgi:hypothetical protein